MTGHPSKGWCRLVLGSGRMPVTAWMRVRIGSRAMLRNCRSMNRGGYDVLGRGSQVVFADDGSDLRWQSSQAGLLGRWRW